jgi:hypothetical protein
MAHERLGIRWTIGDVSARGFEALRCSILGAWKLFGPSTRYAVGVNTIEVGSARARVGEVPAPVQWIDTTKSIPDFLHDHLDAGLAQGAAWKLAPLRLFDDCKELSLDNDYILWSLPAAVENWLADPAESVLLAEDVRACFGQFASLCDDAPRNLGLRGLPPTLDLERALRDVLRELPATLSSEVDEQGLQVAALTRGRNVHVVPLDDVTIASPFPPHLPYLGRCGAHFCGVNPRVLGWSVEGRPVEEVLAEFWDAHIGEVRHRIELARGAAK